MLTKDDFRKLWLDRESDTQFMDRLKWNPDPWLYAIADGDIRLVPLSRTLLQEDDALAWLLPEWRSAHRDAYPGDPRSVDRDSYVRWLGLYYWHEPRLNFIIYPARWLEPAGHMGFRTNREVWPVCELDQIQGNLEPPYYLEPNHAEQWRAVRKGIMSKAFHVINYIVQPDVWTVYPRPENEAAKRFYSRLGFVPVDKPGHMYEGTCEAWEWHKEKPLA